MRDYRQHLRESWTIDKLKRHLVNLTEDEVVALGIGLLWQKYGDYILAYIVHDCTGIPM